MSKSISMLISVLALFWCVVSSSQQHLVCKNIEDVFTDDGLAETRPRRRGIHGPPGQMGSKGERGIRGLPGAEGSPGRVDYDRVDDVIDEKITNEYDCRREGELLHSGKCFTLHMSSSDDMNYEEAVAECAKHEALLAEIHDRVQQSTLYEFALTKMPAGRSYFYVWLGMEYKHSTSNLLYRSGMEKDSSQFQWYPGYPSSSSSRKYMSMYVRNDGGSNYGIFNDPPSTRFGVMCEKET